MQADGQWWQGEKGEVRLWEAGFYCICIVVFAVIHCACVRARSCALYSYSMHTIPV